MKPASINKNTVSDEKFWMRKYLSDYCTIYLDFDFHDEKIMSIMVILINEKM